VSGFSRSSAHDRCSARPAEAGHYVKAGFVVAAGFSRPSGGSIVHGCPAEAGRYVKARASVLPRYHGPDAMPRGPTFKTVEAIGRTLPDVEVTTTWGKPTLKVRGRMFVCIASHKSAEPNTLVVMMDFADRELLIADDPDTYYLKEHYVNYPCVLVRLSKARADALRDLVTGAHRFVSGRMKRKRRNE
jgi:hypothetical protein